MPLRSSMAPTSVSSAGAQPARRTAAAVQSRAVREAGTEMLRLHSSLYTSLENSVSSRYQEGQCDNLKNKQKKKGAILYTAFA